MPRLNSVDELFRRINKVELIRPILSAGIIATQTTTDETVEVAEVDLTVVVWAGFVANDATILVGDGGVEANQVTVAGSGVVSHLYKAEYAHSLGARLIRAEKIPLGEVETGGFTINGSQSSTDIESATSQTVLATDPGARSYDVSFGLLGHNIENMQLWGGEREVVTGTGTATDPYQGSLGGKNRDAVGPLVVRCSGLTRDARLFHFDCLNMTLTLSGSKTMGKGGASTYPITGKITHLIKRIWLP